MWDCSPVKKRRSGVKGFTLIELLVVISIIALLLSVLVPALSKAKEKARRLQDTSNMRQFAMVCIAYSSDNKGWLPKGNNMGTSADNNIAASDWGNINWTTWKMLKDSYKLENKNALCASWERELTQRYNVWMEKNSPYSDPFFVTGILGPNPATEAHLTRIGVRYFGRQGDHANPTYSPKKKNGAVYKSPKRTSDTLHEMGSRTLVTCYYWDNANVGAKIPHVKGERMGKYNVGADTSDGPDGLAVGYIDGSAEFAKWQNMEYFTYGSTKGYYIPNR